MSGWGSGEGRLVASARSSEPSVTVTSLSKDGTTRLREVAMQKDSWLDQAACRGMDTDLFYPTQNGLREYREICSGCPVRSQCLEFGLREPLGIWGGASARERRRIMVKRRIPA